MCSLSILIYIYDIYIQKYDNGTGRLLKAQNIYILMCTGCQARGLKDPEGAKRRMEQKAAAAREVETGGGGEGGMKWQVG